VYDPDTILVRLDGILGSERRKKQAEKRRRMALDDGVCPWSMGRVNPEGSSAKAEEVQRET
jgi:hypothetical protein